MDKENELMVIELSRDIDNFCKTLYNTDALSFCQNGCTRQAECRNRRKSLAKVTAIVEKAKEEMRLFMVGQHEIECALCKAKQKLG